MLPNRSKLYSKWLILGRRRFEPFVGPPFFRWFCYFSDSPVQRLILSGTIVSPIRATLFFIRTPKAPFSGLTVKREVFLSHVQAAPPPMLERNGLKIGRSSLLVGIFDTWCFRIDRNALPNGRVRATSVLALCWAFSTFCVPESIETPSRIADWGRRL